MANELKRFNELSALQKKQQPIVDKKIDELLAESANDLITLVCFLKKLKAKRKRDLRSEYCNTNFVGICELFFNYSLPKHD
ncbi:hypothetical protein [Pseudoalteromonas nigrifaciens]|jgi:hypothetical protein|uniref:hypothetical protein n=1 Tax=Pseudoalteromonas nigrifaciens TaxID=28109 RepID=UPI0030CA3129|tara:strand:- start:722 stop:964 length:243 start_codon:yes stop_codon:yes gene_type:complete